MRYHGFYYRIYDAIAAITIVMVAIAREVFRYCAETAWHSLRTAGVAAYRKIAHLKPVYRDSYATHGLSLSDGRAG